MILIRVVKSVKVGLELALRVQRLLDAPIVFLVFFYLISELVT